ncbi:hypothetical protein LCGC14_0692970 [marine sediment metagenome]|uniref:Uncharacterized protein n=1 Tax=marine sediment metagenome TaxID=412755 RepID=A0A0F9QK14_9ZZZZ
MAEELFQNYNAGDDGAAYSNNGRRLMQTFTVSEWHRTTKLKLLMYRTGSPGALTVSLHPLDGSNEPLTSLASLNIPSPFGGLDLAATWETFFLAALLETGVKYGISIWANAAGQPYTGRAYWRADTTSPTYAGGEARRRLGGTWSDLGYDFMFEEHGDKIILPTPVYAVAGIAAPSVAIADVPPSSVGGLNPALAELML